MNELLNRSVEEFEFSVRVYNCLKRAEINTIGDLVQQSESALLRTREFGPISLREIRDFLAERGLYLGMKFDSDGRLIGEMEPAVVSTLSALNVTALIMSTELREEPFRKRWDFFASVFLQPHEIEDFIGLQEDLFERNYKRFGPRRAKFLYRVYTLRSLKPLAARLLHRLLAFEAIRRLFHY